MTNGSIFSNGGGTTCSTSGTSCGEPLLFLRALSLMKPGVTSSMFTLS